MESAVEEIRAEGLIVLIMFSGLMIALPITFVIGLAEFMGTRGVVVA
jgi:hypothetical protein